MLHPISKISNRQHNNADNHKVNNIRCRLAFTVLALETKDKANEHSCQQRPIVPIVCDSPYIHAAFRATFKRQRILQRILPHRKERRGQYASSN